jgi:hypothetical protein
MSRILIFKVLALCLASFMFASNVNASNFYWMDTWVRVPTGAPTYVCTGDYPSKVGGLCFRKEKCSSRKGKGKNWGYKFDGATTCWRKKETTATKAPKSYPAPSRAMSPRCNAGKVNIAGLCYNQCPSGMVGVTPVCASKVPPKYVQCGLGYAKSTSACTWAIADQTMAGTNFAFAVSGNFIAAKAGIASKLAGKLSKMPSRFSGDFLSIASKISKVGDASTTTRIATIFETAATTWLADPELAQIASFGGITSVPSVLNKIASGQSFSTQDTEDLMEFVRDFSGLMSLAIGLAMPTPGPQDNVAVMLDMIAAYAYTIYP